MSGCNIGEWLRECSIFRRELENNPHLCNTEVSKAFQSLSARREVEITSA